jgi:hypothetical protein
MDCQTALEFLDCVRPDSDDLDLPEMADARAHLNSCDVCQEAFAEMQNFDRSVTVVVQNVDVPVHLLSALLEASAENVATVSGVAAETFSNDSGSTAVAPASRRRVLQIVVSTVCALILGVVAWQWQSQSEQFTETELLERLPLDLSLTGQFDSGFEFSLPATWAGNRRLRVGREFRGIDLDDVAGHDAAVASFSYLPSRNAPVNGILAAIPANRIPALPKAGSFAQADAQYIPKDGRLVAAVWRERDTVYVCLVLGSAADLERIQRNLSTSAA